MAMAVGLVAAVVAGAAAAAVAAAWAAVAALAGAGGLIAARAGHECLIAASALRQATLQVEHDVAVEHGGPPPITPGPEPPPVASP
jgi:hypothetical protein